MYIRVEAVWWLLKRLNSSPPPGIHWGKVLDMSATFPVLWSSHTKRKRKWCQAMSLFGPVTTLASYYFQLRVRFHWAIAIAKATSQIIGYWWFQWNYSHLETWNIKGKFRVHFHNRSVWIYPNPNLPYQVTSLFNWDLYPFEWKAKKSQSFRIRFRIVWLNL